MLQKDVKYWYRRALVEMRKVCVLTAYDDPEYVGVDVVVADTGVLHGTFAGLQDLRECASKAPDQVSICPRCGGKDVTWTSGDPLGTHAGKLFITEDGDGICPCCGIGKLVGGFY